MSHWKICLTFAVVVTCGCSPISFAGEEVPERFNLYYENDQFNSTDDHYTLGVRFNWSQVGPEVPWFLARIPFYSLKDWAYAKSTFGGLQLYTPRDLREADFQPDDRPYAAWMYGGVGLDRYGPKTTRPWEGERYTFRERLELTIGAIGPSVHAEQIQRQFHQAFGGADPQGWQYQLHDELAANMFYSKKSLAYAHNFKRDNGDAGAWGVDSFTQYGFSLGNVMIHQTASVEGRIGFHLPDNFALDKLPVSLTRSGANDHTAWMSAEVEDGPPPLRAYLTVGTEVKLIEHSIFLDGNTHRDSHSVDKEYLVGEAHAGFGFHFCDRVTLTAVQVVRSKEFEQQLDDNWFTAINLSVAW